MKNARKHEFINYEMSKFENFEKVCESRNKIDE